MQYSLLLLSCLLLTCDIVSKTEGLDHLLQEANCDLYSTDYVEKCELSAVDIDEETGDPCLSFEFITRKPIGNECKFYVTVTKLEGTQESDTGIFSNGTVCSMMVPGNGLGEEISRLGNIPRGMCPIAKGAYGSHCHTVDQAFLPAMLKSGTYNVYLNLECHNEPICQLSVSTAVLD